MKKSILSLALTAMAFTLSGCWERTEPQSFTRPVKLSEVQSLNVYDKEFVGVVTAEQYTNYAFRVGGLIKKTFVTDGSMVKKGELMAELDAGDFALQVAADKAQYQTTQSILERSKRLLEKQAISVQDYEIAQANFQKAKSAYEYSENQLSYTKLRAPFTGSVEKKYVEDYQKVNPGEPVFKIINPDVLEVKFTLPQSDVNITQVGTFYVEFDNIPNTRYTARVKEVVDASVDGAGIPVILAITDKSFNPMKNNIKAGFACRIQVAIENSDYTADLCTVPVTAVFSKEDNKEQTFVWVYNPQSKNVSSKSVSIRGMYGKDSYVISGGVKSGEQVVTAGVYQIVDGQKVNVL